MAQETNTDATRSVTAGIYLSPPFVDVRGQGYDGMAVQLWQLVSNRLGISTQYVAYSTFGDLVRATSSGEVDFAITNLTITRERAEILLFTQPWYDAGLRILVPDDGQNGFWGVVDGLRASGHLRAYAWLVFVIFLASIVLTLFDRRFDPAFPKRWREGIAESLFHVVSVAKSGRTARKNLFGWKGRVWSSIWTVCGVAVIAYITSSVTSVMTARSLDRGISTLADLSGRTAGVFTGSVAENLVSELGIASHSYPDIQAAVQALQQGRVDAIIADAPILEYFAHAHSERKFNVVGNLFHPDKYGFAFPNGSDLARPVTLQLLKFMEDGTVGELRTRYFGSGT